MEDHKEEEQRKVKLTDPKQLTTVFKKNGAFDNQRKLLLEDFRQSQTYKNLLLKLQIIVEQKVKNDPTILNKNKGKMAALIQGEIINNHNKDKSERSSSADSILSVIEKDIQSRVIDSPSLHKKIHIDVLKIRSEILGISEREFNESVKMVEKQEQTEAQNRTMSYSNGSRSAFSQPSSGMSSHTKSYKNNYISNSIHDRNRVIKPPRFNINSRKLQNPRDRDDDEKVNEIEY